MGPALVLKNYQKKWGKKAVNILNENYFYLDVSQTGRGKTFVSLWVAKKIKYPIFVICPLTVSSEWRNLANKYNIEMIDIITYQSFRGISNKKFNHEYLESNSETKKEGEAEIISIGDEMVDIINRGTFFIFDEVQNLKNDSRQTIIISLITKYIIQSKSDSRFCLLGAYLYDKKASSINFFDILGYSIPSKEMNVISPIVKNSLLQSKLKIPKKLYTIIFRCYQENASLTKDALGKYTEAEDLFHFLFVNIIIEKYAGSIDPPDNITSEIDIKNGFYLVEGESKTIIDFNLNRINNILVESKQISVGNRSIINMSLMEIEHEKIVVFERIARKKLENNKNSKVIIYANFTKTIDDLDKLLSDFGPLILKGDTKKKDRDSIIYDFNNDSKSRLIISNIKVGGVGISLHDIVGDFPRYMYISPTYSVIDMMQAIGRIYRNGTKSKATVRIVYTDTDLDEENVMGRLIKIIEKKSDNVETLLKDDTGNYMLPKYFGTYREKFE